MGIHRASCEDCSWSEEGEDLVEGASYRVDCWACDEQIAAAANYCPDCGEVQLQGDEDPEVVDSAEEEDDECAIPGCEWPPEWAHSDQCIRHDYEMFAFWEPLANFSIDERIVATDGSTCRDGTERTTNASADSSQTKGAAALIECGTIHLTSRKRLHPQEQTAIPIGRILPSKSFFAAYTVSQRSHTPTTRLWSRKAITPTKRGAVLSINPIYYTPVNPRRETVSLYSLYMGTEQDGGSR